MITRDEFEAKYHSVAARLSGLIKPVAEQNVTLNNSMDPNQTLIIRCLEELLSRNMSNGPRLRSLLSSLPLESFSGDYGNWYRFYKAFVSRIEMDNYLSNIDKLLPEEDGMN